MGIRKKVAAGFAALALLVVGAGAVSFFELSRVGRHTQNILDGSSRDMDIARDLLDGAEKMHLSLVNGFVSGYAEAARDSIYLAGRKIFDGALENARKAGNASADGVERAFGRYEDVSQEFFSGAAPHGGEWLRTVYTDAYLALTAAVREYMADSGYDLEAQARIIEHNAYRAVTPGLVTLGVILLLLFVLLYFIDIYHMRPMVKMDRALDNWIKYNTPFNVGFEGRDEACRLNENIEELIARIKSGRKQE